MSVPGESAVLLGTELEVSGSALTVKDLTVQDVPSDAGIEVDGTGNRLEHNTIQHVGYAGSAGGGILLHTDASGTTITRNFVQNIGPPGGTLFHGIYVQGANQTVTRNVFADTVGGYGIQVYSSPSHVLVAENTVDHSLTRSGIVVQTTGSDITVRDNLFTGSVGAGITARSCGAPCSINHNLTFGNGGGDCDPCVNVTGTIHADPVYVDQRFRVAAVSPAVDAAFSPGVFPDLDGVTMPAGLGPDMGAYER